MIFSQTIKNLGRLREILGVLVKYGFDDVIQHSGFENFVSEKLHLEWMRRDKPAFEYSTYERMRMVAEELGPSFIKLAQVLSNRPDILPHGLIKEFEKLQNDVPPFSTQDAINIIESETGKKIYKLFRDFDDKPIGSASIGQVHRATLRNGDKVVVKVRRPSVKEAVETDLAIMREIVKRGKNFLENNLGVIHAMDAVNTFEKSIFKELDYRTEARHLAQFKKFYADYKGFYIPKVYKHLSTERILVMEFVEGVPINSIKQLKEWGLKPEKIAERGLDIYLMQIFEYGYFHADPHPGNVLVQQNGTICLIDFGMVGKIMQRDKFSFAMLLTSMAQLDSRRMALHFKRLAIEDKIDDIRQFEYELNELIEDFAMLEVEENNVADLTLRLQKIIYDYRIRIPGSVFLIMRALAIIEGIGKTMHPHFNANSFIIPYGAKLLKEQYGWDNMRNELLYRSGQIVSLLNNIPTEVKQIMRLTRTGKLTFKMQHEGYEPAMKKAEKLVNRINLTLLVCAISIASAITTTTSWPNMPRVYGIPYISFLGFAIAGGLFLILCYIMFLRRK